MESWAKRWDRWYLQALPAYLVLLVFCTHAPHLTLPGPRDSDKLAHAGAFAVLAFLLWRFCEALRRPVSAGFFVLAWIVVAAIAGGDEYTQQFFGRDTDFWDWVADMVGVTTLIAFLEWRRRGRFRCAARARPGAVVK